MKQSDLIGSLSIPIAFSVAVAFGPTWGFVAALACCAAAAEVAVATS